MVVTEGVVTERQPSLRVTPDVTLTPPHRRGQEVAEVGAVVDPVPHQLHAVGQVGLADERTLVLVAAGRGDSWESAPPLVERRAGEATRPVRHRCAQSNERP